MQYVLDVESDYDKLLFFLNSGTEKIYFKL